LASHKPLSGLFFEEISVKTLTTDRFVFVVKSVYWKSLKKKGLMMAYVKLKLFT